MSKQRAKGTGWEVELLPWLRLYFGPQVERAGTTKGNQDQGDYLGVPWLHEAKKTDVPHFLQWAREAAKKAEEWVIIWSGDRRTNKEPLVVMPLSMYERLLYGNLQVSRLRERVQGRWDHDLSS